MITKITPQEFLEKFDPMVHCRLIEAASLPQTDALVLFENVQLDSSQLGKRAALRVGPCCTYVNVAATEGHWLNDLPSQRQYPQSYVEASELVAFGKEAAHVR